MSHLTLNIPAASGHIAFPNGTKIYLKIKVFYLVNMKRGQYVYIYIYIYILLNVFSYSLQADRLMTGLNLPSHLVLGGISIPEIWGERERVIEWVVILII